MVDSNRNANASEFGWQFQIFSGIMAALKDINNIKSINIEGPLQDVQLSKKNGKELLIQAKAYKTSNIEENTKTGWGDKLSSAMIGLFEDFLDNKDNVFKYYINFPYPLGKEKGGKNNFGLKKYGETYGDELTEKQRKIIKLKINSFIQNPKTGTKTKLTLKEVQNNFDYFINKVAFRYCNFLNFRDDDRKYESLDEAISNFLYNNKISASVKRLRDYWISKSFDNGSYKYAINRSNFLFGIVIVKNSFSSDELMGHTLNISQLNTLYDRFRSVIESTFALEEFNRQLVTDLFKIEKITDISDYKFREDEAIKFINKVYNNYIKYFDLLNLKKKEKIELTKYALEHFLLEEDNINYLFEKELKNAN